MQKTNYKMKLIAKSKYGGKLTLAEEKRTTGDTVKDHLKQNSGEQENYDTVTFLRAKTAHANLSNFRDRRKRTTRFIYGDQLGDIVIGKDGKPTTLRHKLEKELKGPASQDNHMIKIENAMEGLYAKGQGKPTCYATQDSANQKSTVLNGALQDNYDLNVLGELLADQWRECLRGGLPVVVTEYRSEKGVEDVYTYPVNPDYFFFSGKGRDPRMWDVDLVGEIRDYTVNELAIELSGGDTDCKSLMNMIRAIYPSVTAKDGLDLSEQQTEKNKNVTWEQPQPGYCRTYHVWTREAKTRLRVVDIMDREHPLYKVELDELDGIKEQNMKRMEEGTTMGLAPEDIPLIEYKEVWDEYWHFRMFAPDGRILVEYDSPYEHKSHPYTFIACKFVDGDIIPFMSMYVDQQKFINDLVMMKKLMINKSIKGLKMIPTTILGGMSPREFADMSLEIGDYLFYTPNDRFPEAKPEIINASIDVTGVDQMLEMEIRNISDLSNVNESIRGKSPAAGTPYSSYALMSENASTSLVSGLNTFNVFENELANKILDMILQYYNEPRWVSNVYATDLQTMVMYDPKEVQDVRHFVKIRSAADSPVARMALNNIAAQLKADGDLDALGMMEGSYFPGKEIIIAALQNTLQRRQQLIADQQQGGGGNGDQMAANMNAGAVPITDTLPKRFPTMG